MKYICTNCGSEAWVVANERCPLHLCGCEKCKSLFLCEKDNHGMIKAKKKVRKKHLFGLIKEKYENVYAAISVMD